jgi:vacuolar-type H+-ATPase subunit C/Vma6
MSKYTSTIEGFQKLVQWSLDGPATDEDVKAYVESTSTSTFYQVINGKRTEYDDYVKHIKEWRGKASDYKVEV